MRKKQDIMWEQSTLWESVEKWVTKHLKKNHSEYRELQAKAMRIVEENPALRILTNSMEGIVLTPEDHKALLELPQLTPRRMGIPTGLRPIPTRSAHGYSNKEQTLFQECFCMPK